MSTEQSKLATRQTDIALGQSSTVQKLTYLTIAYLPVGLTAVRSICMRVFQG